jgi:DNA replication protein DnaC
VDTNPEEPFLGYKTMVNAVGKRHATCWFDNYDVGTDEVAMRRQLALNAVKDYARQLESHRDTGKNLVLVGSCGTGKDHLAVSVLRVALSMKWIVRYRRGSVICSECRQSMLETSKDVPHDLWSADLLVVSDIEPHADKAASEFEQRALLELIDRRYTAMLPTIVTSNKVAKPDLIKAIGERVVDRLYENAVIVPMIWPSYRAR